VSEKFVGNSFPSQWLLLIFFISLLLKGTTPRPIAVIRGDGIGPEISDATMAILKAAGARIEPRYVEAGEKIYLKGIQSGLEPEAMNTIRETKVLLKGPITTPRGGGYKSLNVTIRKTLGLYANVRPCHSYSPFVFTKHPGMNVLIVRENEEDLYAGIEHRQTHQVTQCLKLISRPGCEKIVRYAFEYARTNKRKKVSCFVKDNIMKITDGLFASVFNDIAKEYPEIKTDTWIIDIGAARLADTPTIFDVIVTPNLYGDIISDIAAQVTGSVGLGGSSNIGDHVAMFEAIHGSAPDISGKNISNPSGLLLGAVMMLEHIQQPDIAERIHNAWLKTLEDRIFTVDLKSSIQDGKGTIVSTTDFTKAVIGNLGKVPQTLPKAYYNPDAKPITPHPISVDKSVKAGVGVDVFLDFKGSPDELGDKIKKISEGDLSLQMITNRGVKVYPNGFPETFCTDHWRCRFENKEKNITNDSILALLNSINKAGFDIIKTENLYTFDGKPGYSLGQGQ
jgi:isocitrate dehydrogenase